MTVVARVAVAGVADGAEARVGFAGDGARAVDVPAVAGALVTCGAVAAVRVCRVSGSGLQALQQRHARVSPMRLAGLASTRHTMGMSANSSLSGGVTATPLRAMQVSLQELWRLVTHDSFGLAAAAASSGTGAGPAGAAAAAAASVGASPPSSPRLALAAGSSSSSRAHSRAACRHGAPAICRSIGSRVSLERACGRAGSRWSELARLLPNSQGAGGCDEAGRL